MRDAALRTILVLGAVAMSAPVEAKPMPIVRLAELTIAPDQVEAYKAHLREEIEASVRIEPGVLMLYAVAVRGRPDQIRLTEVYADQAAYEAHVHSPHFLKYKAATADMVRGLTLVDTDPIALAGKTGDRP